MRIKLVAAVLLVSLAVIAPAAAQRAEPPTISIGVLSLFHPQVLVLTSVHPLPVQVGAASFILAPRHPLTLRVSGTVFTYSAGGLPGSSAAQLTLPGSDFVLTVPNKLSRRYIGALLITTQQGRLQATVVMPTETAVASIVAAEAPPGASAAALQAQAVVSRSFLLAAPRPHQDFNACDTTHCQFLRSPPPASSPATLAAQSTRGLVLTWRTAPGAPARIIAAMYSRSCGGRTRALASAAPGSYPFYPVRCSYCQAHPEAWSRPLPAGVLIDEATRLAYNRLHGWSAIPSNTHHASAGLLTGRGTGHGLGLCQLGAQDLARRGEAFAAILSHFYPGTVLTRLP